MSRVQFEDDEIEREFAAAKRKRFWTIVIIVIILVALACIYLPQILGGDLFGGTTKYKLTESKKSMALSNSYYVTTESYVEFKNVKKENGVIKSAYIVVHIVYDNGDWREFEGNMFLQRNSSDGQTYSVPSNFAWDSVVIVNGKIGLVYNWHGYLTADLTFQ